MRIIILKTLLIVSVAKYCRFISYVKFLSKIQYQVPQGETLNMYFQNFQTLSLKVYCDLL